MMTRNIRPAIVIVLWALILPFTRSVPARLPEVPPEVVPSSSVLPAARRVEWSIVVHQAPFNCPPCERLKPEIAKLREAGWNVTVKVGGVNSYPTIIMLEGDREHKRASGYVDAVTIADWPKAEAKQANEQRAQRTRPRWLGYCATCR